MVLAQASVTTGAAALACQPRCELQQPSKSPRRDHFFHLLNIEFYFLDIAQKHTDILVLRHNDFPPEFFARIIPPRPHYSRRYVMRIEAEQNECHALKELPFSS